MTKLEEMIETYRPFYGEETEALFKALLEHERKIALINPFLSAQEAQKLKSHGTPANFFGANFFHLPSDLAPYVVDGLLSHYFLDQSSALAPHFLPLENGDHILDMCSAPGGKLLALLAKNKAKVTYLANDMSSARIFRLRKVLRQYVPGDFLAQNIRTTNKDANWFGQKMAETFDAILLDAPCSSEAHIVNNPSLLNKFSGLRKSLPLRQYSLLCSALLALKPHGYLLYATCSINPHENELLIEKFINKKGQHFSVQKISAPFGAPRKHGLLVLPHKDLCGPAYVCLIQKK